MIVSLVVSAIVLLVAASSGSAAVTYVTQWGTLGGGNGQFGGPIAVATAPSGKVLVSDLFTAGLSQTARVQQFSPSGTWEATWGSFGTLPGQFTSPGAVATSPSGDFYVGDYSLNRIQRFSSTGLLLGSWGTGGSGDGQFAAPWGIAVDPQGKVYVVDYGNNRIQKFGPSGNFLAQWGSFGSGDGQFLAPSFIATDSSGHVYVADSGNSRIQKFSSGGKYLDQWASPGPGAGVADFPLGIATDPKGNVYVVGTNSIQKYNPSGVILTRWGSYGNGKGQFRSPQGIAADSNGNVYVGDSGNSRVQKFLDPGPPYPDPGTARLGLKLPSVIRVRGGRTAVIVVRVRNNGSNPVRKAVVCVPPDFNTGRRVSKVGCARPGSIAVGGSKVVRLPVRSRCRTPGMTRLGLRASAANAPAATTRVSILVTACPVRSQGPLPEGLG